MSESLGRKLVHVLDARIQKQRLKDMKNAALKKKIPLSENFSPDVTHIVTEFTDFDAVLRKLNKTDATILDKVEVVSVLWFTDCLKNGKIVDVEARHRLKRSSVEDRNAGGVTEPSPSNPVQMMAEYGCQRATPLKHLNEKFTAAFEVLEKFADLREGDHDYSRSLAFRRAACVLKSLPFHLTSIQQLRNVTNIGDHCKRIIQEIIEEGESSEVQTILDDPWFHKMKLFTSIFGIGPSTAKQFISNDWSTVREAREGYRSGDWRVQWGLSFHNDLTTPVLRSEAHYIQEMVQKHLHTILPGAIMTVTGGFRRGKQAGHDVDLLITHPQEDKVNGVLIRLLQRLESTDTVLCGKLERSTYNGEVLSKKSKLSSRGQLDHFEKWIGIIKVPKKVREQTRRKDEVDKSELVSEGNNSKSSDVRTNNCMNSFDDNKTIFTKNADQTSQGSCDTANRTETLPAVDGSVEATQLTCANATKGLKRDTAPYELAQEDRTWLARRVDLIISPYSQYYYALVGWTGSKQFNRDARLYAERKLSMMLTSHGLYDYNLGRSIPASSEKEVFDNLKLPYHDPVDRNC